MPEPTASPERVTVYVELLEEGTVCLRPVEAVVRGNVYTLIAPPDYDPQSERWAFPPGSRVRCRAEPWSGGVVLVAREGAE